MQSGDDGLIPNLQLRIRDVTEISDGLFLIEGKATGEDVIPDDWTDFVCDYLPGKPILWRHEKDDSIGEWRNATFGEVHEAKKSEEGVIDFKAHMFATSTYHKSLIKEVKECQQNGKPMGLSITTETHTRNGKTKIVYPKELTLTPVPVCKSCVTRGFFEVDETMTEKDGTQIAVSLQEQLSKKENELKETQDALVQMANEVEESKKLLKETAESLKKAEKERDDLISRTDELKTKLAEYEKVALKAQRDPLINQIKEHEGDQWMVDNVYNDWPLDKLRERLKIVQEKSVQRFDTSSAIPQSTPQSNDQGARLVGEFLIKNGNSDLLNNLKRKAESASRVAGK